MWEFLEVNNLAIRELEKVELPVAKRIALYHKFAVNTTFLIPHYAILCSRNEPLDNVESEILGMKSTVLVFQARERLRTQPSGGSKSPLPHGISRHHVVDMIENMIGIDMPPSTPTEAKNCQ
jgi:hypothetical protein